MSKHNIMVKATTLGNVCGRIDYISNPKRQEHLQAVYETVGKEFWKALADHCQQQSKYSQTKKAVEGREWMIPLANELAQMYEPAELAYLASKKIKEKTGTENVVAVHWNKKKNNYHIHVVSAENKEIDKVKEGAVLRQNTYFDENGKRSIKKQCVDQDGNLKLGCTFLKKGERKVVQMRFGPKIDEIGSKDFLQELKLEMAMWQNELLEEERFRVFDSSLYIAEQHIGKNLEEGVIDRIEAKNTLVRAYNDMVDKILQLTLNFGKNAYFAELVGIKKIRKNIKKFALRESWPKAIEYHLNNMNLKYEELTEYVRKSHQNNVETFEQKDSIMDQIKTAESVRQSHKIIYSQKSNDREL